VRRGWGHPAAGSECLPSPSTAGPPAAPSPLPTHTASLRPAAAATPGGHTAPRRSAWAPQHQKKQVYWCYWAGRAAGCCVGWHGGGAPPGCTRLQRVPPQPGALPPVLRGPIRGRCRAQHAGACACRGEMPGRSACSWRGEAARWHRHRHRGRPGTPLTRKISSHYTGARPAPRQQVIKAIIAADCAGKGGREREGSGCPAVPRGASPAGRPAHGGPRCPHLALCGAENRHRRPPASPPRCPQHLRSPAASGHWQTDPCPGQPRARCKGGHRVPTRCPRHRVPMSRPLSPGVSAPRVSAPRPQQRLGGGRGCPLSPGEPLAASGLTKPALVMNELVRRVRVTMELPN